MNDTKRLLDSINTDLLELMDRLEEVAEDDQQVCTELNEIIDLLADASEKLDELCETDEE